MSKKIEVYSGESHQENWPPDKLVEFRDWINTQIDKIPAKYQGSAEIDIRFYEAYEGSEFNHINLAIDIEYTVEDA